MFELEMPWWEFIVRAVVVYCVLLLMVRLSGRRTVGQLRPFDLLVVMLLSEGVSNSLTGPDESLVGGLIVAATLIFLNTLAAIATARSRKLSALLEGTPILIARDGQVFDDARKAARVGEDDIEQALHEADCTMEDVKCIFLEADGSLSVLQRRSKAG